MVSGQFRGLPRLPRISFSGLPMFPILLFTMFAGPPDISPSKPDPGNATYSVTQNVAVGEVAFITGKGAWYKLPDAPGTLITTATGAAYVSPVKGSFTILCASADGVAFAKIVVGDPVVPVPPVVVNDDFKDKLIAAAKKDNDKGSLVQLSAFYSAPVGQKLAQDTTITTVKDLIARIKVTSVLDAGKVPNVRAVIGAQLAAQFKPDQPLTAETRKQLVDLFAKIESTLDFLSN